MKVILMFDKPYSCSECRLYVSGICSGSENDIFTNSSFEDVENDINPDCPLIEVNNNIVKLIEVAR